MNDDSVLVWAKLKNELPELVTFSICTWVKFTYEVRLLPGPFFLVNFFLEYCRVVSINVHYLVIRKSTFCLKDTVYKDRKSPS